MMFLTYSFVHLLFCPVVWRVAWLVNVTIQSDTVPHSKSFFTIPLSRCEHFLVRLHFPCLNYFVICPCLFPVPTSPVQTRIVVPLASSSSRDQSFSKSQEIIVNEGQNITLFCIIQSAPPPTVATYPFDQNFTHDSRFQLDEKFGTFTSLKSL